MLKHSEMKKDIPDPFFTVKYPNEVKNEENPEFQNNPWNY